MKYSLNQKMIIILLHMALFATSLNSMQYDYEEIFGRDFRWATQFFDKNREVATLITDNGGEPEVLIPVVFPELVRYSLLRDEMETTALEIFYVQLGRDYADFSIGLFQMKPSFIERLEKEAVIRPLPDNLKAISVFSSSSSPEEVRRIRVRRLQDLKWQVKYLVCFEQIIEAIYAQESWASVEDKIKFFAAAYNSGVWYNKNRIREIINEPVYPFGSDYDGNQFRYSDISVYYYTEYLNVNKSSSLKLR